ncbi:hypothetical protein [Marixanthomonas ophiurae]|uniref:Sulfotransferase family protein n=1 Tax=Marixanthomonas ophiurae TaxID=387659 RepID=A0A3E1QD16_9FLAO|nr:hypothetical protein [Marixanthomonas ophiurae]RFN60033.1 hypothetical protein DZ858_08290 [Marixanthomonas ophiurae]
MIITEKFIMINFPKTGTAFARKILMDLHTNPSFWDKAQFNLGLKKKPFFQNLLLPNIRTASARKGFMNEHGICEQIPIGHKNKPIVSIKRDVFKRYISMYNYEHWKKWPFINRTIIKEKYPNYPELTFEEFVHFLIDYNPLSYHPKVKRELPIGPLTAQYILFYFKNPFQVLKNIDKEYIDSKSYMQDRYSIHFLDQNNLNQDLYNYLLKMDYDKNKIEYILYAPKTNNSTPKGKGVEDYFTKDLKKLVSEKESFLLELNRL